MFQRIYRGVLSCGTTILGQGNLTVSRTSYLLIFFFVAPTSASLRPSNGTGTHLTRKQFTSILSINQWAKRME